MKKVVLIGWFIILFFSMSTIHADIGDFFSDDSDWGGSYDYNSSWHDSRSSSFDNWGSRDSSWISSTEKTDSNRSSSLYSSNSNGLYDDTLLKFFYVILRV